MPADDPTVTRTEGTPHDRLTRLCAAMCETLDAHPERGAEKCIVFLQDVKTGGIQLHGYDNDNDAMVDLLLHLRALFRAQGKDLELITIPDDVSGLA